MARTTATVSFQAIELKGSLLPGSLLEQVARLQAPLQKEADYGLAKGERLRERIDAAWVRLKEIWEEYRDLRERAAQSTAGLHASARILREVLGWPDLQPCSGWQHGDAHFPISHRAFGGAVPVILRGIAADQLDKGSSQFGQEGRRRSPHSCLQECLNADDNANWGLLLTGDRLRLLHDNPSLVKPAYLAVDLELLVEGELFDEFAVLWLLLHASRFRHPQTGSCVLDAWKEQAQEAGERVLGQLRNGVQQALEALGNGLLQHPDNEALRNQLASGALSGQELHRQLLRLVYRFLFLFTAEDRDLLFPRTLGQEDPRRRIYREGYSVGRLRELAIRRSASEGPYGDLWQTQKLVFLQLRQSSSPLGLPGLGGLFAEPQCVALEQCELVNRFLLRAIRAIGWFQAGDTLTRVNYRDLNTEELGSVYEGLLELHPQLERAGGSWQLSYGGGAGSDRKTTGSYYTPDQLVQLLIVSALLPVIADRLGKASKPVEKEQALLAIRVLDPACGSGHFLLSAARRLALELARIRAGDEEPSEELRQECLREVVAHCIYGVDKNPMAVELCKVALWIEAVDPGKPLSFLDAHIQCGDSLVGVFDPKVLEQGIPDEAYKPLTGDDKPTCTSLKKENASFRKAGQKGTLQGTLNLQSTPPISRCQQRHQEIEAMPETTLAEGAAKQAAYEAWEQERSGDPQTLAADLYTAAFFLPKTKDSRPKVPTSEHLLLLQSGQEIPGELELAVEQAARDFRFFHWFLRFGEVMERGGFDCVLGNPPWEMPQVNETEFFCEYPEIVQSSGAERKAMIASLLKAHPDIANRIDFHKRSLSALIVYRKGASSGSLLKDARKPNMFSIFTELAYVHLSAGTDTPASLGLVIPTNFFTDEGSSKLASSAVSNGHLESCLDFSNRERIFKQVQGNMHFSLVTLIKNTRQRQKARMACQIADIDSLHVLAPRIYYVSPEEAKILNPDTLSLPICACQDDVSHLIKIHSARRRSTLDVKQGLFNMTSDSGLFIKLEKIHGHDDVISLFESKNIGIYDSRYSDFLGIPEDKMYGTHPATRKLTLPEKLDIDYSIKTRFFVRASDLEQRISGEWSHDYFLVARTIMSASQDSRSVRATLIPRVAIGHSLAVIFPEANEPEFHLFTLANLNSLVIDFCAKKKISGANLNGFMIRQLPLISRSALTTDDLSFVSTRARLLLARNGSLPSSLLPEERDIHERLSKEDKEVLTAELDAYFAHLYLLDRDGLRYILDPADVMGPDCPSETFRVLKNNELRQFGEYRTQRLVLEAWDRLFGS